MPIRAVLYRATTLSSLLPWCQEEPGDLDTARYHSTRRRTHDRGVLARATIVFARPGGFWVEAPAHVRAALYYLLGSDSILKNPSLDHIPWRCGRITQHMLGRNRRVAAWHELYVRMTLTSVCILPAQRGMSVVVLAARKGLASREHAARRRYAVQCRG